MRMGSVGRWGLVSVQRGRHPHLQPLLGGLGDSLLPLEETRFPWALSSIGQCFQVRLWQQTAPNVSDIHVRGSGCALSSHSRSRPSADAMPGGQGHFYSLTPHQPKHVPWPRLSEETINVFSP